MNRRRTIRTALLSALMATQLGAGGCANTEQDGTPSFQLGDSQVAASPARNSSAAMAPKADSMHHRAVIVRRHVPHRIHKTTPAAGPDQ